MSSLYISECSENTTNIIYLKEGISDVFVNLNIAKIYADKHRTVGIFNFDDDIYERAKDLIRDKIADVICVAYKYSLFEDKINLRGLSTLHKEFLLSSLISADIEDDKRYIKAKLSFENNYCAIDGFYTFKIKPLIKKWHEITEYIPGYFSERELKEFITFLIKEKRGKKVYIENDKVYDKKYNLLKRSDLIPNANGFKLFKEILLSGAGEIFLKGDLPIKEAEYLKEYFDGKISYIRG